MEQTLSPQEFSVFILKAYNFANSASWGATVRFATSLSFLIAALLLAHPLPSQTVNMERPTEINAQHHRSSEEIRQRLSASRVQQDVKELGELCAAVTTDMESLKQGLLPKDAGERLKRMEKLSKRMRDNLTRASTEN
jgi:hypothetical protein